MKLTWSSVTRQAGQPVPQVGSRETSSSPFGFGALFRVWHAWR